MLKKLSRLLFILVLSFVLVPSSIQAVTLPGPVIRIYDESHNFVREFYAYDSNLTIGVNAVMADVTGDGQEEIITAPQADAAPYLKMFSLTGELLTPGWYAFATDFHGGVNLATGDLTGDGVADLVVAQASAGQAWVKAYDLTGQTPRIITEFLAYPTSFDGGADVTVGDIDGDGHAEIITGAGQGGGPQVRAFDKHGIWTGLAFFPFPEDFTGGVTVAAGNLNKTAMDELVVGQASAAQAWVKIYDANGQHIINTFKAYPADVQYGVTVSIADKKIITGPGSDGGPQVREFNTQGENLSNFFGYDDEAFRGQTSAQYSPERQRYIVTVAPVKSEPIITGPKVALTFDDGYSSSHGSFNKILDTLKARNVHVTFFLLGDWIEDHPTEMRRIIADGHEVANHSYHHPLFTRLTADQIKNEVISNEQLIKQFGVDPKPNFRYPYGGHNAYTDAIIASLGYRYWQWTASTGDTGPNRNSVTAVTNGALANLHDGGIILSHLSSDATAAALDNIITAIQNSGYTIVKISQLDSD
ncbi:MAG: polysaccharide deacetylase family protein [Patescibacteria group bacterium]